MVACTLRGSGLDVEVHRGSVAVANSEVLTPSKQPLALTTVGHYGASGGHFRVACGADGTAGAVSAHQIKIMAMRVGTLKRVPYRGASTTTGSGSPTVVLGSRQGPVNLPQDTPVTVARLWLKPGAWWIRANFTFDDNIGGYAECALSYAGTVRDRAYGETDHVSAVIAMDVAAASSAGQWATVRCTGHMYDELPGGPQFVSDVRISAVKLGRLVRDGRAGPTTYGSGNPVAKFKSVQSRVLAPFQWTTLTEVDVAAGNWMFLGKAEISLNGPITCQLVAAADNDQVELGTWGVQTFPFATVHRFRNAGKASIRCFLSSSELAQAIRLTAFKLGSLNKVPI